jgi:hypothetical protein
MGKRKIKLEPWQQPIIFKDPRYTTLTKAEHTELTKDIAHPVTWPNKKGRSTTTKAIDNLYTGKANDGIQ